MDRLETKLTRLVEDHVLTASQAQQLVDAARADRMDGQSVPLCTLLSRSPLRD